MRRKQKSKAGAAVELRADPFGERLARSHLRRYGKPGGRLLIDTNSAALAELADIAFSGLPASCLPADQPPMRISLRLSDCASLGRVSAPPAPQFNTAAGLVTAVIDACNHAVVVPALRLARVVLSSDMLQFPYNARYELIEFALYTLATHAAGLLPVHAACVAKNNDGVLLVGDSGAGKSTLSLHCLEQGMRLLSDDTVFIDTKRMFAGALTNFVHMRPEAVPGIESTSIRQLIAGCSTIRRRSGQLKHELDLRTLGFGLATSQVPVTTIVFLQPGKRNRIPMARLSSPRSIMSLLEHTQTFGRTCAQWPAFARQAATLRCMSLARSGTPSSLARLIQSLI